ncbi:MAG: class I SAM-dependent methyltransferase [Bacteroidota bacterium]|nr:class I SAM-dependent methyltransferase [Bacteroidota bacterium]MDP4232077.1 class I SAM-dependent methyltransferase [Bacteroidota bacterium]MDP4241216.1 class I SAM-dependent methyltransferase [Bacteroidota bacterium]MDP4286608.1 class I SAM-dependent methyltransferase [Bacteroidota bacterium]
MTDTVPHSRFDNAYTGDAPPWDIPGPQKAFVDIADQIHGRVLDSGCGTGENALYFAARGCTVTGIDFAEPAIRRAKEKSRERGIAVNFLVKDALTLTEWDEQFDNILDSGVFHVFGDVDAEKYVRSLAHVLKPGGRLFLICFSDAEPGTHGPNRIPKQMIYDRFGAGWTIESVTATRFSVRPENDGTTFSKGGPHAWFAIIRRTND